MYTEPLSEVQQQQRLREISLIEAGRLIGSNGVGYHSDVLAAANAYYEFLKGETK